MNDYRDNGISTYGNKCEICGHGLVEVHHIDYKTHQQYEDRLRQLVKLKKPIDDLMSEAQSKGFLEWDGRNLSKDDRTTNLSVLCPNHHTLIHTLDSGISLFKVLPKRR